MAHEILLNSGDSIDEADLQTAFAAMGKGYIEQDALDVQYFDSDDTIDTTPAVARVPDNNRDIPLFVDAITGYSLEANAVNSVYLVVDPAAATDDEAVGLQHNTTGVVPSNPSLLIAEVDTNKTGSDAVTLKSRGTAPSLEGADMNPRSIGQATPAQSIAAETGTFAGNPPPFDGSVNLSSFTSLETAINYSSDNDVPVHVDGQFTFDETNISLPQESTLVGDWRVSRINIDTTGGDPLFVHDRTTRTDMHWSGVLFRNAGPARPFIVSADGSGFLGPDTRWRDIRIEEFGATSANPYTVDITDAYASAFENIHVWNKFRTTLGSYRFDNCNASQFRSLKFAGHPDNGSGDGETPVIYAVGCEGTLFDAPHVENHITDAVMQMHFGNVLVSGGHFEGHNGSHNAGIQIGDGGVTAGNTGGRTGPATTTTIVAPTIHDGHASPMDDIRVLNNESVTLVGVQGEDGTLTVNYGGSNNNNNNNSNLTTDLSDLVLVGCIGADVRDFSGMVDPPVLKLDSNFLNFTPTTDVAASRTFGTAYQNTSGEPIYVKAWINSASTLHARLRVGPSTAPPARDAAKLQNSSGNEQVATLAGFVPASHHYTIQDAGGGATLSSVIEREV